MMQINFLASYYNYLLLQLFLGEKKNVRSPYLVETKDIEFL